MTDLDALKAALEKATPGDWWTSAGDLFAGDCLVGDCGAWQDTDDNAAAIVLAVNTLRQPGALELLALLNGPDDATVERVARNLNEQMEAEQDEYTPSSVQRERGLIWLSGWFDLRAALAAVKEAKAAALKSQAALVAELEATVAAQAAGVEAQAARVAELEATSKQFAEDCIIMARSNKEKDATIAAQAAEIERLRVDNKDLRTRIFFCSGSCGPIHLYDEHDPDAALEPRT